MNQTLDWITSITAFIRKKLVVEQLLEQLLTELLAIQVMKKMSILMQF